MINRNNYENLYVQFSKNNQVTLAMKSKELELFEKARFHGFKRFGNSKSGIWFGPILIQISLEMLFLKFFYTPFFTLETFDYFDRSGVEYAVFCNLKTFSRENEDFTWVYSPYNENKEFKQFLDYDAKFINKSAISNSTTEEKVRRIKEDSQITLDFGKPITILDMVNQISILSGHAYDEEERLRVLYFLYIYFKKLDKAREILDKWYSEKRWLNFDPREKELLDNPDMYIEYINEIKKMKKYSKLKEIEVKE